MTIPRSAAGSWVAARTIVAWSVAALAALVLSVVAVNSFRAIGEPFPGFFVWENLFVPAVGDDSWTGIQAGLGYRCWIEAVEGRPVSEVGDLTSVLAERRSGEPIRYTVSKGGGESTEVAVPFDVFTVNDYLITNGIFLFDSIVLLGLGVMLLYLNPTSAGGLAVFFFAISQSLYLSTSVDLFGPYWFRRTYIFFAGATPLATLIMLSYFPVRRERRRAEDVAIVVGVLAVIALGIGWNWAFFNDRALLIRLDGACHLAMAGSAAAAFFFFAYQALRSPHFEVRQRSKVVLLGSLMAFLPTMLFLFLVFSGVLSIPFNFLAIPFLCFPIAITYAVAKHDLFDVDRLIKRSLAYVTLSVGMLALYTGGITLVDVAFEQSSIVVSRIAEGGVIVALLLLSIPGRKRVQDAVDGLYDRRSYDYRDVVRSASRAFTTMLDHSTLVPAVLGLIDETVQPEFAEIFTTDSIGVLHSRGRLEHEAGMPRHLETYAEPLAAPQLEPVRTALRTRDFIDPRRDNTEPELQLAYLCLREMKAGLALAMPIEGRLAGILVVGNRRAGGELTDYDADLLQTIADQMAVATTNAESYSTIHLLNENLGETNQALRKAYRDLHKTQSVLVTKERLAAIGELSSAVAHSIRNPLAGMRAAAQQATRELSEHPTQELVEDFIFETDRLNHRISALLDYARPFEPDRRHSVLEEVVDAAVHSSRGRAEEAKLSLKIERPSSPTSARVDPLLFEQLVTELLANAIEATPGGGTVVAASGVDADGEPFIEVRDSGVGIRPETHKTMFQLFFTTKGSGTGFGLATVKKIVDGHGGRIVVGEAPEGGAAFKILVPNLTNSEGGDHEDSYFANL
ncbi:MAG: signal transduction histidine kinase [Myxococcota bacterium]|jgi:signal transduction histidine kinase